MSIIVICILIAISNAIFMGIMTDSGILGALFLSLAPTLFMCTVINLLYDILIRINAALAPPLFRKKEETTPHRSSEQR
ncbi:hypothetical protein [Aureibacillus halotolerans]|uniref:Uncharacterized protein n=1 Tax=Aureibacillus halotolerans TaxID=1508390 RepID=A0A4R6U336_9BACI|nr:hypothetical protein [Aureibacillus halotolerans]TDQ40790.1 hypothetical protein EV213_105136 [Aureibacillus halotolerans]